MTNVQRRVRFSAALNQEIESTCDGDRITQLWYCDSESKAIRSAAQMIAKESIQSGMAQLLDVSFGANAPANDVQEKLSRWSQYAHSRRGLETLVSKLQRRQRRSHKQLILHTVLGAQEKLRATNWTGDEKADLIAQLCLRQTGPAKEFAARMGQADVPVRIASHLNEISSRVKPYQRPLRSGYPRRYKTQRNESPWTGSPISVATFRSGTLLGQIDISS
jgi:hypothetical protein